MALIAEASAVSTTQIVILALAAAGLTAVMLSTRRRIRSSQRLDNVPARQRYARLTEQSEARDDVQEVMLELDKLSRHIHGQIDTRLARLEALIRDADQRIAKLSQMRDAPQATGGVDVRLDREEPAVSEKNREGIDDRRFSHVYRLAETGLPPAEIAQKVGKTVGEIELMLALRRTRQEAHVAEK